MNEKISVLMSLYIKEKPKYLKECLNSILNQTVFPDEIIMVIDGPITDELENTLQSFENAYPSLIKRVPLEKNVGLGLALREGITHCKNEIVARMDTDDVAVKNRFEKQLMVFKNNPNLDVCGSHIIEFEGELENKLAERKVPLTHNEIIKYQKKRSAFNHMTVMYKKSSVLKAGNYENCPLMEDDMLWVRMILSGCKCCNIDDFLVYARTGVAMVERRGGWAYFKKYKHGRKMILKTHFITRMDYFKTVIIQFVVALMPKKMRMWFFTKVLRRK